MSKFTSVRASTKGIAALTMAKASMRVDATKAKVHNLAEETRLARQMAETDLRIQAALREQEKRDKRVLKAAQDVEKVDAEILATEQKFASDMEYLRAKREHFVTEFRQAEQVAEDVTTLPVS